MVPVLPVVNVAKMRRVVTVLPPSLGESGRYEAQSGARSSCCFMENVAQSGALPSCLFGRMVRRVVPSFPLIPSVLDDYSPFCQ